VVADCEIINESMRPVRGKIPTAVAVDELVELDDQAGEFQGSGHPARQSGPCRERDKKV
jgi:hypothetical protein